MNYQESDKKKIGVALALLLLIALGAGLFLILGNEKPSEKTSIASGQEAEDLPKEAPKKTQPPQGKLPEKAPTKTKAKTPLKEPAPVEVKEEKTPEPAKEVKTPKFMRVRIELRPTINDVHTPSLISLVAGIDLEIQSNDDFWSVSLKHQSEGHYQGSVDYLKEVSMAEITIVGRGFVHFRVNLPHNRDDQGNLNFDPLEFDVGELHAEDKLLLRGVYQHPSGQSLAGLDAGSVSLKLRSKQDHLSEWTQSAQVSFDKEGVFWIVIEHHSGIRLGGEQLLIDATLLQITPSVGGDTLSYQSRKGVAYDFGSGQLGGALVKLSARCVLPKPFYALERQDPNNFDPKGLVVNQDMSVEFQLETNDDLFSAAGKLSGKDDYDAIILVAPGSYLVRVIGSVFAADVSKMLQREEVVDLEKRRSDFLQFAFEMPDFSALYIENAGEIYHNEKVKMATMPENAGKEWASQLRSQRSIQSAEQFTRVFEPNWNPDEYDDFRMFYPPEKQSFALMTEKRRAKIVEFPDGPALRVVNLAELWPEQPAEVVKTPPIKITIKIDPNGRNIREDTRLAILFEQARYRGDVLKRYYSTYENGKFEDAIASFETDKYANAKFYVRLWESDGQGGFPLEKVAESYALDLSKGDQTITFKIDVDPLDLESGSETPWLRATCGDNPVEVYDWDITMEGRAMYETSIPLFADQRSQFYGDVKFFQHTLNDFELKFKETARVTIGKELIDRFGKIKLRSDSTSTIVTKPGVFSLYTKDFGRHASIIVEAIQKGNSAFLWDAAYPKHERKAISEFEVPSDLTLVTIRGESQGYRWGLTRAGKEWDGYSINTNETFALRANRYQWHVRRSDVRQTIGSPFTIKAGTPQTIRIPEGKLPKLDGKVRFTLSEAQRTFILGSNLNAGVSNSKQTRAKLGKLRERHETRSRTYRLTIKVEGLVLTVSELPRESDIWIQFYNTTKDGWSLASDPLLIRALASPPSDAASLPPLPQMHRVLHYPRFPRPDEDQLREGLLNLNDDESDVEVEFWRDGALLPAGAVFRHGQEHEVRIFVLSQNSRTPSLILKYGGKGRDGWEDEALEKIQSVIKGVANFQQKTFPPPYSPRGGGGRGGRFSEGPMGD